MLINPPEVWFGSDLSLVNYLNRHEQEPPTQLYAIGRDDEEDDEDPFEELAAGLIERYDSVAVLNIKGSLVNDESYFNLWFGDLAYATIQRAINQLLQDDSVANIVLSLDTPGGDAQGVEELGQFIKDASRIKPITAWASTALSAGYWLAASADQIYTSKMGQTGSIGAITTVMSYYERLRNDGIDPFVARSSPKKAIPHPAEPLTDAGKSVVQARVNQYGEFFIENIVRNRPALSYSGAKTSWASGEVFFGEKALNLGLVDGLKLSLSQLLNEKILAHNSQINSGAQPMAKKLILADLAAARISMGLDPETAAPVIAASEGPGDEEDTDEDDGEVAASAGSPPSDPGTPVAAVLMASDDGLSAYLKEEVTTLKAEVATLKTELATFALTNAQLQAAEAAIGHLRPVAEAAVQRLSIGLGHRPSKLEHLPADMLASTFTDLQAELMALPAGRQTAEPSVDTLDGDVQRDTLAQHRLRLVPAR